MIAPAEAPASSIKNLLLARFYSGTALGWRCAGLTIMLDWAFLWNRLFHLRSGLRSSIVLLVMELVD